MSVTVEALLERLRTTHAIDLLETFDHPEYQELWDHDSGGPRLYRAFARALVAQGHPSLALKLARRGLEQAPFPDDPVLQYTVALAYARGGNPLSAEQRLAPILDAVCNNAAAVADMPPKWRVDVVALRGRLFKDLYQREREPQRKQTLAALSADWYQRAAEIPGSDGFPVVNAATMRLLAGDAAAARALAERVLERTLPAGQRPENAGDYWLHATLGEAYLLRGEQDESLHHYVVAADLAFTSRAIGDLVSMLGNLRLLAEAGATAEPQWLRERLGCVVVFSGHSLDAPQRAAAGLPPCFPDDPALVSRLQAALHDRLRELNAHFGFCSLASGSDVLFAEVMQERGAELHVVLPFAEEDFLATCVHHGRPDAPGPRAWRARFDAVLARLKPDHLHYATTEPYLGTDLLFAHANTFIQGLGVIRARQCLLEPIALAVLDPAAESTAEGPRTFLDNWRQAGLRSEVIDLAALRGDAAKPLPPPGLASLAFARAELPRPIRAMLFADVAGFSRMNEELAPRFFTQFPRVLAEILDCAGDRVLLANTWGDGFFAVFDTVRACAGFALDLLDAAGRGVDWAGMGFPDANPLRIGLHAGPVFELADDPVLHRRNFFGQHVNRAARIEPITIAGCAFASEQFAALLTMEAPDAFRCEVIGVERLPKKSGLLALYRIGRC